ncbi:MAG TPA: PD-(D/E)XK nuclease family protein, partial [Thermomicrobiales bacterium]|nr:PD-(D/E)XK nuclease family protein [Thermomicrobiales bacterium]
MHPEIPTSIDKPGIAPLPISPTDVSQFIRLDQCQRFLRLRLHARSNTMRFLHDYDVQPQGIPPILSRSGAEFEQQVEADVRARHPSHRFSAAERTAAGTSHDNASMVARIRALASGGVLVLFQPRLEADLDGWRMRGDVDLMRCERSAGGNLRILIADMKSSTAAKVEHRLQVAFYHEMLAGILREAGVEHGSIDLAILYRGPAQPPVSIELVRKHEEERRLAAGKLGASVGLLEPLEPQRAYIDAVHELVLGDHAHARRIMQTPFDDLPFHLTMKCDGCLFNEFCMKLAAESDDLSLLPHITENDKAALQRGGVTTTTQLATLMDLQRKGTESIDGQMVEATHLAPAPGRKDEARRLSTTWPVGPRLEELVHRARRYRTFKRDPIDSVSWL